jgi:hypothetical protein
MLKIAIASLEKTYNIQIACAEYMGDGCGLVVGLLIIMFLCAWAFLCMLHSCTMLDNPNSVRERLSDNGLHGMERFGARHLLAVYAWHANR